VAMTGPLLVPAGRTHQDVADPARQEELRALHSDLRLIAQDLADDVLRCRVHAVCARLAALGSPPTGEPSVRLAPRETDVLAMVALGYSNAESARRLSLRPETVKSYLSSAMTKLDAHTRHEAVVRARRLGLLP
jgi:DNA-binding CsgD family transcriptional regulator